MGDGEQEATGDVPDDRDGEKVACPWARHSQETLPSKYLALSKLGRYSAQGFRRGNTLDTPQACVELVLILSLRICSEAITTCIPAGMIGAVNVKVCMRLTTRGVDMLTPMASVALPWPAVAPILIDHWEESSASHTSPTKGQTTPSPKCLTTAKFSWQRGRWASH